MDLSLLPTPASEYNTERTGARFTVRSANSPSYSLVRRSGVRKTRGVLAEEERAPSEEGRERERYADTNGTNKEEDHTVRTGSCSSVKGQCEEKDTSGHKMSKKLNQNGSADKTITESASNKSGNLASESRGRTDSRRYNLSSRSKSLDWRAGERSPDRSKRADVFMLSTKRGGGERRTEVEGVRGRVQSSIQAYNSASTSNDVPEKSPGSQTLDRASRGRSLPSRLCSHSGLQSASLGPKGGQSILERIEKLYGSAGFAKTEEGNISQKASGGTFPRHFSERSSLSPLQSRTSFTWTQKDTSGCESNLSSGTSTTRERWSRYPEEGGVHWSRGLADIGTRSLDRARSRYSVAAQIRAARAAGGITAPLQSNTLLEEDKSLSFSDSPGLRERRASGSKIQGGETNGMNWTLRERSGWLKEEEKGKETDDGAKEKPESKSSSIDEDVFESDPQKITIKTSTLRKVPEMSASSAASVKNKISQFEALTQRSQGLATGQVPMPRRAFSVPTQLSRAHDGVKKSGSAKAIGDMRDKWEGLKEGGEKTDDKGGRKLRSEWSLSLDKVGLRLGRKEKEGNDLVESEAKLTNSSSNPAEDFTKYSRLKNTLQIPLNGGIQSRNFYIDETDFSKVSSPEEASNRPSSLLSNYSETSTAVQKNSEVTSPVSDEDKTPTNTPILRSPTTPEASTPIADGRNKSTSVQAAKHTPEQDFSPLPGPLTTSSHTDFPNLISPGVKVAHPSKKKGVLDLDAWVAGLSTQIKVWNDEEDEDEDDDESTQKDEDSNYDSDSGESSVTITSNMSQSDRRSFSVSLSDLCNFAGVDNESENDSDEWQPVGRRSASLSSDMSALSCVSVLPSEELDKLLEDVRSLGDNNLQDYDDVQVVVLHKEVGAGLGFSLAGGMDQNKPVTVHKVFHSGVAAQEGSIREGDQVLSINGTSLCGYVHWEALRVLRRAKTRDLGVVVLRRGGSSSGCKGGAQTNNLGPTQTQSTETGQRVCVRLEKNSRDLGFSLEGGVGSSQESKPLTVQKIFQGGPVDKVCPGDEVLEIGGVSMVGMRRLEAWTLIRRLPPGPVDVVLRRPPKHLET